MIKSNLFSNFPEIIFGMSTKKTSDKSDIFNNNMSLSIGDDKMNVEGNRLEFYKVLGLNQEHIATQYQIHSNKINHVTKGGFYGESDALITNKKGIGLAISTADCVAIFIYDREKQIIAGVHSGWRGTKVKILDKTIQEMKDKYYCNPSDLFAFIAPSITQKNYEVSLEVANQFEDVYSDIIDQKLCLDLKRVNFDMLINHEIPLKQIEVSYLCSYEEKELLHSFRRDGDKSGRAFGIIAMKEN